METVQHKHPIHLFFINTTLIATAFKYLCHLFIALGILTVFIGCTSTPVYRCISCLPLLLNSQTNYPLKASSNFALYNDEKPISKPPQYSPKNQRIHIYLEGDGKRWAFGRIPPQNPTTTQYTALKLMELDPAPAIYIQRPCYGYTKMPTECHKALWTTARYSNIIVTSLNEAMDEIKYRTNAKEFVLVGHSGGGTLAMLIAAKRDDITAVITLAANLDHEAWTKDKGYAPLQESLNAANVTLPHHVIRWHLSGTNDTQVPTSTTQAGMRHDTQAKLFIKEGMDHGCCWHTIWPDILTKLNLAL